MCSQNNAEDWMMQEPIAWPDTYLDDQTPGEGDHVDRYLLQKQQSAPISSTSAEFKRRESDNAKSELRGKREAAKEKKLKKLLQPKVALETRSDTELLDDGYKWRKYGQKSTKNSKHPRSYYRCTFGGCLVKKRVERSTRDPAVVVTTYQGRHNHYRQDQYSARLSYPYLVDGQPVWSIR